MLAYLGSQFELDLVHEYEAIGASGIRPAQKHPVILALPVYWTWDVISLFWRIKGWKIIRRLPKTDNILLAISPKYSSRFNRLDGTRQKLSVCSGFQVFFLTCWLGPREDELGRAAVLNLPVAGMNVDAVNCERLQARYLQLLFSHLVIHDLVLLIGWLRVREAAVTAALRRGDYGAIGVKLEAACTSGVGNAEKISATAIWRPRGGHNRDDEHKKSTV